WTAAAAAATAAPAGHPKSRRPSSPRILLGSRTPRPQRLAFRRPRPRAPTAAIPLDSWFDPNPPCAHSPLLRRLPHAPAADRGTATAAPLQESVTPIRADLPPRLRRCMFAPPVGP